MPEYPNHWGNVMAVISDEASDTNEPTVVSLSDYYPYGMTEPGRSWNSGDYRFGYTGHEKEEDLASGVYTTEYRLLDARLGRWLSVDPLSSASPNIGLYVYCGGNPMLMMDPDGRDGKVTGSGTEEDPYVVTAVYYYDDQISKDAQKALKDAISSYNNGELWKCGKKEEKIYVMFNLKVEKVESVSTDNRRANRINDYFYYGNIITTETWENRNNIFLP